MFTNKEVRDYAYLLDTLNNDDDRPFPEDYVIVKQGGGRDGVPHFKLLKNETKRVYVIWVRGTRFTDPNDVLINIRTSPFTFFDGFIHTGYLLAAINVIRIIQNNLNDQRIDKIVCLGHSLGGAVASSITAILQKGFTTPRIHVDEIRRRFTSEKIRGLVFASPPVFSSNISIETRNYITNIILINDIVPKLSGLFNALTRLQRMIVTHQYTMYNALPNNLNVSTVDNLVQRYNLLAANPDRIPGNVIIIDPSRGNIEQGENNRTTRSVLDYLGIIDHAFSLYYQAVLDLISDDDNVHIEDSINVNAMVEAQPESDDQNYYLNNGTVEHPVYEGIDTENIDLANIVFRKPLKYVYNDSCITELADALACFEVLYENIPQTQKNKPAAPRLLHIASRFYNFAHVGANKKFPRDLIESYSLCYAIFGNRPITLEQIKENFSNAAESVIGSLQVTVICFPVNLDGRENIKRELNANVNGQPYNAYICAHNTMQRISLAVRALNFLRNAFFLGTMGPTFLASAILNPLNTSRTIVAANEIMNENTRVIRRRDGVENRWESFYDD